MTAPTITPSNLMQGPAEVLFAPFGTAEPANATTAPAAAWVPGGATDGGITGTLGQTYSDLTVDQVGMAVTARPTDQVAQIATVFAEPTLANLRVALNRAADVATKFEFGGELLDNTEPYFRAAMIRGGKPGGGRRLIIVRRCLVKENVAMAYQKDGKTMIPVTFTGYFVSASVRAAVVDDTQGV